MKYIMFKARNSKGLRVTHFAPVIFPSSMVHADVAKSMLAGPLKGYKVHSAGEINPLNMVVYGSSETLGVQHDDCDTDRIKRADYGGLFS